MADLHQGTFNSFCRIYQTARQMQYAVHVLFCSFKKNRSGAHKGIRSPSKWQPLRPSCQFVARSAWHCLSEAPSRGQGDWLGLTSYDSFIRYLSPAYADAPGHLFVFRPPQPRLSPFLSSHRLNADHRLAHGPEISTKSKYGKLLEQSHSQR